MECRRVSGRKGKRVAHLLSTTVCYQWFMHSFGLFDRDLRSHPTFLLLWEQAMVSKGQDGMRGRMWSRGRVSIHPRFELIPNS